MIIDHEIPNPYRKMPAKIRAVFHGSKILVYPINSPVQRQPRMAREKPLFFCIHIFDIDVIQIPARPLPKVIMPYRYLPKRAKIAVKRHYKRLGGT